MSHYFGEKIYIVEKIQMGIDTVLTRRHHQKTTELEKNKFKTSSSSTKREERFLSNVHTNIFIYVVNIIFDIITVGYK